MSTFTGMEANAVISTLTALMGAEPEVAEGFLIAAVYCRAIRLGTDPRNITEALWKAVPDSHAWPALREALVEQLGEAE